MLDKEIIRVLDMSVAMDVGVPTIKKIVNMGLVSGQIKLESEKDKQILKKYLEYKKIGDFNEFST